MKKSFIKIDIDPVINGNVKKTHFNVSSKNVPKIFVSSTILTMIIYIQVKEFNNRLEEILEGSADRH